MNLEKLYYYRKQEKHYTAKILEQLLSVWKSKIYLQMGYSTIYKFLVQHLHYSEHEANARIAALQLMKRSAVAAKEVSEGKISPSSARVIEQHLKEKEKTTKLTRENVAKIVQSVSSLSMRKTDQKLQTMLQTKARKTQVLYIHENLQIKLDRVKQQYDVDLSNSELIEILLEEKLKDPEVSNQVKTKAKAKTKASEIVNKTDIVNTNKKVREKIRATNKTVIVNCAKNTSEKIQSENKAAIVNRAKNTNEKIQSENKKFKMDKKQCKKNITKKSRYIPKKVKQEVWLRSQGKCEHPSCEERRNLEYDHIIPYSKKGANSLENIQLLCRAHNQWKSNFMQ